MFTISVLQIRELKLREQEVPKITKPESDGPRIKHGTCSQSPYISQPKWLKAQILMSNRWCSSPKAASSTVSFGNITYSPSASASSWLKEKNNTLVRDLFGGIKWDHSYTGFSICLAQSNSQQTVPAIISKLYCTPNKTILVKLKWGNNSEVPGIQLDK